MAMDSPGVPRGPLLALVAWLVVSLLLPATAKAEVLGRLFLTPEQRTALDKQRFAPEPEKRPAPEVTVTKQEEAPPPAPVHSFRMEGLVVRSQGPNTAWVDGFQVLRRGRTFQGVTVDPSAARGTGLTVQVPGAGDAVALKPGQTFNPENAEVSELRSRGGPGAGPAVTPGGGEAPGTEHGADAGSEVEGR